METGMNNEIVLLPSTPADIEAVRKRCKAMVTRRALASAGASMLPIPGLDLAADVGLLLELIPQINRAFGLTQEQIENLNPKKRIVVYQAVVALGGAMIGRIITRDLVLQALKAVGVRITSKQAVKYVPIAGQALSAALGFAAMRFVGLRHVDDCVRVVRHVIEEENQARRVYPTAERVG